MQVQFTVSSDQWEILQDLAARNHYPDVPSYCKDASLEAHTYADMWLQVKDKVKAMVSGATFQLKDLVQTPPANLGVKLYEHQVPLSIKVNPHKTNGANSFTKL